MKKTKLKKAGKEKKTPKAKKIIKKQKAVKTKRANPTKKAATKTVSSKAFNISLPTDMLTKLDKKIATEAKKAGTKITRSGFIRDKIIAAL